MFRKERSEGKSQPCRENPELTAGEILVEGGGVRRAHAAGRAVSAVVTEEMQLGLLTGPLRGRCQCRLSPRTGRDEGVSYRKEAGSAFSFSLRSLVCDDDRVS